MSILIVGEKPAVARAITAVVGAKTQNDGYYEGNGYTVSWCLGHLAGLKAPDEYCDEWAAHWSFEQLPMIPDTYRLKAAEKSIKQFNVLKKLMNSDKTTEIICATDADREGECIFRYVYELVGCKKPVKRLWVSSLEEKAIRDGMNDLKPQSEYDDLYRAGFARAKADWLVGMNASRLFTVRYGDTLNIGRVKTPTLAMIVKRDYEIKNFVKQKYFTVELDCGAYTASTERIDDENIANALADKCSGKNASVTDVKREVKTVNPPKLFDLTTLQREANKKFGYTAKQTLDYTQALYEGKLVTYPRTDSQYITDTEVGTAQNVLTSLPNQFGIEVEAPDFSRVVNADKVGGHHAIIPTERIGSEEFDINTLPQGEKNILTLVVFRLAMAVSAPHKYEAVTVSVSCEGTVFTAKGRTVLENGWKDIENSLKTTEKEDKEDAKALPQIIQGDTYENVKAERSEHWTSPPKPYTEDTLLSAMEHAGQEEYDDETEKKGLGTPATRARIIEEIIKDGYAERNKKNITATKRGCDLIDVVPEEVKYPKLTAEWEMKLQQIQRGEFTASEFMNGIESYVRKICANYSSIDESKTFRQREVIGKCPRCGKNIIEGKMSFYCESGKDGCGFTLWKSMKYPQTSISAKQAKELLEKGTTQLTAVSKAGKEYTSYFKIEDTGQYINLVFADTPSIGKCPKCGGEIARATDGFYCKAKCGMGFRIYGKYLSETQMKALLNGKKCTITTNGHKNIVLPEVVSNEYQGKTYYNYKTQKAEQ